MATVRHLGLFPFCFDPSTAFFKGKELRTIAVPMWWRVKIWEADVSITYPRGDNPSETISETLTLDVTNLAYGSVSNELDLVCLETDHLPQASPSQPFEHNLLFYLGPFFDVIFETDGETDTIATNLSGATQTGTLELQFLDIQKELPMYSFIAQGQSASVFLRAVEYWPYDPGDGKGPIYNKDTGQQLRPFPS